jgi:hypothetical protein
MVEDKSGLRAELQQRIDRKNKKIQALNTEIEQY